MDRYHELQHNFTLWGAEAIFTLRKREKMIDKGRIRLTSERKINLKAKRARRKSPLRHLARKASTIAAWKRNRERERTSWQNRTRKTKSRWLVERRKEKEEVSWKRWIRARARYSQLTKRWNDPRTNDLTRKEKARKGVSSAHACWKWKEQVNSKPSKGKRKTWGHRCIRSVHKDASLTRTRQSRRIWKKRKMSLGIYGLNGWHCSKANGSQAERRAR